MWQILQLIMRRVWRGIREFVTVIGIIMLVLCTSFPAGIYVHENIPQWEVPVLFAALVIALPLVWLAWRWRQQHKRLQGVTILLAVIFGGLSVCLAIVHGWAQELEILYGAAAVIFLIAFCIVMFRLSRGLETNLRAFGAEVSHARQAMYFHDDGQRIVVYQRRGSLVLLCLITVFGLVICGIFFMLLENANPVWETIIRIVALAGACLALNAFLAHLYRLVVRRPSLVVGPDGIHENASITWSGVGLLRWDEIIAVQGEARKQSFATYHYLDIWVIDIRAIRQRQPLLKRLAMRLASYTSLSRIVITQWMLDTPVDRIADQINHYIETHAPPAWFAHLEDDDDNDDKENNLTT